MNVLVADEKRLNATRKGSAAERRGRALNPNIPNSLLEEGMFV